MKTARKISQSPIMALFLSFLILFVSCNQDDIVENQLSKYSGKELFKGLIFYDGNVADLFGFTSDQKELKNRLDDNLISQLHGIQEDVIQVLETKDENYFSNFKKSIVSKNHFEIQNTLQSYSKDLKEAIFTLYNFDIRTQSSVDNMVKKLNANSKIESLKNDKGEVDIEKVNELFQKESQTNFSKREGGKDTMLCLAIVIVVVVALLWVWEHAYSQSITSNEMMSSSNFQLENLVNEIVKHK